MWCKDAIVLVRSHSNGPCVHACSLMHLWDFVEQRISVYVLHLFRLSCNKINHQTLSHSSNRTSLAISFQYFAKISLRYFKSKSKTIYLCKILRRYFKNWKNRLWCGYDNLYTYCTDIYYLSISVSGIGEVSETSSWEGPGLPD